MVTATACSTVTKFIGYDRWRVHWWKPRLKASPSSATRINVILYHRGGFLCCSLMIYAASHWVVAAGNCLNTGLSKEQAWFNMVFCFWSGNKGGRTRERKTFQDSEKPGQYCKVAEMIEQ